MHNNQKEGVFGPDSKPQPRALEQTRRRAAAERLALSPRGAPSHVTHPGSKRRENVPSDPRPVLLNVRAHAHPRAPAGAAWPLDHADASTQRNGDTIICSHRPFGDQSATWCTGNSAMYDLYVYLYPPLVLPAVLCRCGHSICLAGWPRRSAACRGAPPLFLSPRAATMTRAPSFEPAGPQAV